jgi:hypothetical protein
LSKKPNPRYLSIVSLYQALCLYYLEPDNPRAAKEELLKVNPAEFTKHASLRQLYQSLIHEVGTVSTTNELEQKKEIAKQYHPSKFMKRYFEVGVEMGANPDQIKIAKIELGNMIENIKIQIKQKKPKTPEETLAIIHSYIHDQYKFTFKDQGDLIKGLGDHQLDCDMVSLLFYETGLQLNLPIGMRQVFGYPANHILVSWEQKNKKMIYWESLATENTPKQYQDEMDLKNKLGKLQSIQPVAASSVSYGPEKVLADKYILQAMEIQSTIQFLTALNKGQPLDSKDAIMLKGNAILKKVLALDTDNIPAHVLLNQPKKAIAIAIRIGGEEYGKFMEDLLKKSDKK